MSGGNVEPARAAPAQQRRRADVRARTCARSGRALRVGARRSASSTPIPTSASCSTPASSSARAARRSPACSGSRPASGTRRPRASRPTPPPRLPDRRRPAQPRRQRARAPLRRAGRPRRRHAPVAVGRRGLARARRGRLVGARADAPGRARPRPRRCASCRGRSSALELFNRGTRRAHHLAVALAIAHHQRVDDRLLLTLWHLAERWGRVHADGIVVPLPLSHQRLADLVGAHRQSVTTAMGDADARAARSAAATTATGCCTARRPRSCATTGWWRR